MTTTTVNDIVKANAVERTRANLRAALDSVRAAIEDAERIIARHGDDASGIELCNRVMSKLAWAQANAMSSIESAYAAADDAHKVAIIDAEAR